MGKWRGLTALWRGFLLHMSTMISQQLECSFPICFICLSGITPIKAVYSHETVSPLILMALIMALTQTNWRTDCQLLWQASEDLTGCVWSCCKQPQSGSTETKEDSIPLKSSDWAWLNIEDVSEGKSWKFHKEWMGLYMVLSHLGNINYHIKPEGVKGKIKVIHRNCLKLIKGDLRDEKGFDEPSTTKDLLWTFSWIEQCLPPDFNLEDLEIRNSLN